MPRIGEKTAVRLIQQFGSLESVYEHIDLAEPEKLRDLPRTHEGQARHSKQMSPFAPTCPPLDRRRKALDRQKATSSVERVPQPVPRIPESGVEVVEAAPPKRRPTSDGLRKTASVHSCND
jgi:DNA polymerase-1